MENCQRPHLPIVVFLPLVSEHGPNDVSRVFDHHFPGLDGFLAKQTATVNRRPAVGNMKTQVCSSDLKVLLPFGAFRIMSCCKHTLEWILLDFCPSYWASGLALFISSSKNGKSTEQLQAQSA